MANRMLTLHERRLGITPFNSRAWRIREMQIKLRVAKKQGRTSSVAPRHVVEKPGLIKSLMKKRFFAVALLALLALPSVSSASIDSNLKYGSKGPAVVELQEFLIDKGLLGSEATGNFYTLTRRAVISYQASVNLPATGFVGFLTRAKINAELADVASTSDAAEISEWGATTTPATTSTLDDLKAILKVLTDQLEAQLNLQKQMTDAQKAGNEKLDEIKENTSAPAPVEPAPTAPSPEPPQIVRALELVASATEAKVKGEQAIVVDVFYKEDGVSKNTFEGKPIVITMTTPQGSETGEISAFDKTKGWWRGFAYRPQTAGTTTLSFSAAGLTSTLDVVGKE